MKSTITYYYRGTVERGRPTRGRPGYKVFDGYSENSESGGVSYPWLTYRECQAEAKARGCRAVFVRGK